MQPSDRRLVTEADLAQMLAGGAADVRFEGKSGASGSGTAATLTSTSFVPIPIGIGTLGSIDTNIGGGTWDAVNYTWQVPVTGLYLCVLNCRIVDSSSSRSTYLNVHTSNADHPSGVWIQQGGNIRDVRQMIRLATFFAGDLLRAVIYSDGATYPLNAASLGITLVRAS